MKKSPTPRPLCSKRHDVNEATGDCRVCGRHVTELTRPAFERGDRVLVDAKLAAVVLIKKNDALVHIPSLPLGHRYAIVPVIQLVKA